MSESLNEVIKRLKEQNSLKPQAPPVKPAKVKQVQKEPEVELPTAEELSAMEDENGDIIGDFDEDEEENKENEDKKASQMPQAKENKPESDDNTQQIAELLRNLQDNGIFRLRLLTSLDQINKTFASIDQNIKSLCDYFAMKNG